MVAALGVAAGALQALGYIIYVRQHEPRPGGVTWLAWSAGAVVALALGLDADLPMAVLGLPLVCLIAALTLAAGRLVRRDLRPGPWDPAALSLAVLLSAAAVGFASEGISVGTAALFALLPVLSAPMAPPLLSGTEARPLCRFVWSAAYGMMALAMIAAALPWSFLLYPLVGQALHLALGLIALAGGESPAPRRTEALAWRRGISASSR